MLKALRATPGLNWEHNHLVALNTCLIEALRAFYDELRDISDDDMNKLLLFDLDGTNIKFPITIKETYFHPEIICDTPLKLTEFFYDIAWRAAHRHVDYDDIARAMHFKLFFQVRGYWIPILRWGQLHDETNAQLLERMQLSGNKTLYNNYMKNEYTDMDGPDRNAMEKFKQIDPKYIMHTMQHVLWDHLSGIYGIRKSLKLDADNVSKVCAEHVKKYYLDITSENGAVYPYAQASGNTTLTYYIVCGLNDGAEFLLKCQADPYAKDQAGKNALVLLVLLGRDGLEKAVFPFVNAWIGYKIFDRQHHILDLILQNPDTPKHINEQVGEKKYTALHAACARGDARLIKPLISAGADPTIRDASGRTPIDILNLPSEDRMKEVEENLQEGFPPRSGNVHFDGITNWYINVNARPTCTAGDIALWRRQYEDGTLTITKTSDTETIPKTPLTHIEDESHARALRTPRTEEETIPETPEVLRTEAEDRHPIEQVANTEEETIPPLSDTKDKAPIGIPNIKTEDKTPTATLPESDTGSEEHVTTKTEESITRISPQKNEYVPRGTTGIDTSEKINDVAVTTSATPYRGRSPGIRPDNRDDAALREEPRAPNKYGISELCKLVVAAGNVLAFLYLILHLISCRVYTPSPLVELVAKQEQKNTDKHEISVL